MPRARDRRRLKRKVNSSRYACRCPGLTPPWWVSQQPALHQGRDAVHAGEQFVGVGARRGDRLGLMGVLLPTGRRVARPPVGDDDRSGINMIQQERSQRGGARIVDDLHATTAQRPSDLLNSDHDQCLAQGAASPASGLRAADDRLVDLDDRARDLLETSCAWRRTRSADRLNVRWSILRFARSSQHSLIGVLLMLFSSRMISEVVQPFWAAVRLAALAGGLPVPAMRGRAGVEAPGRSVVVWSVRSSYLADGGDDLSRHPDAAHHIVPTLQVALHDRACAVVARSKANGCGPVPDPELVERAARRRATR